LIKPKTQNRIKHSSGTATRAVFAGEQIEGARQSFSGPPKDQKVQKGKYKKGGEKKKRINDTFPRFFSLSVRARKITQIFTSDILSRTILS
jgi:hypothetical protein